MVHNGFERRIADPVGGEQLRCVVDDYLFLTFRKNLGVDVPLTVEVSSDLITWSSDSAMIELVSKADNGDGTATVTFRFDRPIGQGQNQAFVRLRGN